MKNKEKNLYNTGSALWKIKKKNLYNTGSALWKKKKKELCKKRGGSQNFSFKFTIFWKL